jgi:hypothetical protein
MSSVPHSSAPVDPIRAMLVAIGAALCPPPGPVHPDSIEHEIHAAMLREFAMLRLGDDVALDGDHDDCPRDCGRCGQVLGPDDAYQCSACIGGAA